jgi:hypothetical protein
MNELDLQPLVDAALILGEEDREMRACETALAIIEDGAANATPQSLERRLRDIGTWSDRTKTTRWTTPALWERLRDRIDRKADHPEVMALMGRLLTQAHALRSGITRMRRRVRDLELVLVGAVRDLQSESLDCRLLRLVAGENRGMTVTEMHEAVEKDHAAIADAMATWKLSNGAAAVFSIRDGNTPDEVQKALRRLERTGHARRTGPLLAVTRWTLTQVPEDDRKRA